MLINTYFNIGDECFIINDSSIIKCIVSGIFINNLIIGAFKNKQEGFKMPFNAELHTELELINGNYKYYKMPTHCYKTKEELIEYIIKLKL